tara:strand:- start:10355 stop:10903 length:549 start_codon:yes stop_codon:yes gene_type:complete
MALRFAEKLARWELSNRELLPAMIASVVRLTEPPGKRLVGVHRTYLSKDSSKAPGVSRKALGTISQSCVPLGRPINGRIAVTEGIESALAVQQSSPIYCWAAISAPGIRSLVLTDDVTDVVIYAEPDPAGEAAAAAAAERWSEEGRVVRIATSTEGDANDILMRDGPLAVRALLTGAKLYCG